METVNSMTPLFHFSPSAVLKRTLSLLCKRPLLFFGLTFLAVAPPTLVNFFLPDEGLQASMQLVCMILGLFMSGAIACAVYHSMQGEPISMGQAISRGMARVAPLLGVSVLSGLGIMAGTLLLLVPGLILMCIWAVVIPVCVVERLGVIASLRRSAQLTKGYRMSIFGLMVMIMLFNFAVVLGVGLILGSLFGDALFAASFLGFATILPMAFQYVMTAIVYYDLRAAKEGISLENLTSVFD